MTMQQKVMIGDDRYDGYKKQKNLKSKLDFCIAEKMLFAFSSFDNDQQQIWQEQLMTYSLFRYFMQGFEKR